MAQQVSSQKADCMYQVFWIYKPGYLSGLPQNQGRIRSWYAQHSAIYPDVTMEAEVAYYTLTED